MARALTIDNILNKKYKTFDFTGEWFDAFGTPETTGVWFIWGASGSGKTSFILQLIKELSKYDRIFYNSLEEGKRLVLHNGLHRAGFEGHKYNNRILVEEEDKDTLIARISKPKSPNIVIIDSFQVFGLNFKDYLELKKMFPNKLFIYISQVEGKQPASAPARQAKHDADLKIWVEGFRAISNGRYFGTVGYYTVWEERAAEYWLNK